MTKTLNETFGSWKTTLVGFMTAVTLSWNQLQLLLDNDAATQPDWNIIVAAIMAFVLGFFARDNDVPSEQAIRKPKNKRFPS